MKTHSRNILSISLRRNRLGFAVFRDGVLLCYAVKTFNGEMTRPIRKRAFVTWLNQLIQTYEASTVVLPGLNQQQRHSSDLRYLHASVIRHCLIAKSLRVRIQDTRHVRQRVCGTDKATNRNVFAHLMKIYPELRRFKRSGSLWETNYYHHLINAIAGGFAFITSDLREDA